MDIIGKEVQHKTFGIGTVTEKNNDQIKVAFKRGEKIFIYPSIFENLMVALDSSVNMSIQQDVTAFQNKKAQAARLENERAAIRRAEIELEEQKKKQQSKNTTKSMPEKHYSPKNKVRDPNQRSTFFVFQGNTFDRESKGGYIWAPINSLGGGTCFHWQRLLDVRVGDIIFHGYNAQIRAISLAKSNCYNCLQPNELLQEELWDTEGRRVDCEYKLIKNPIQTASFREEILQFSTAKYSPFDKDGNGNMGYLFDLDRDLAKVFLKGIISTNSNLDNLDFISELLAEQ